MIGGPAELVADFAEEAGDAVVFEVAMEGELRCGDIASGSGGQRAALGGLLDEGGAGLVSEVSGAARE